MVRTSRTLRDENTGGRRGLTEATNVAPTSRSLRDGPSSPRKAQSESPVPPMGFEARERVCSCGVDRKRVAGREEILFESR